MKKNRMLRMHTGRLLRVGGGALIFRKTNSKNEASHFMRNIILHPSSLTLSLVTYVDVSCISLFNPANHNWFSIDLAWLNKGQFCLKKKKKKGREYCFTHLTVSNEFRKSLMVSNLRPSPPHGRRSNIPTSQHLI